MIAQHTIDRFWELCHNKHLGIQHPNSAQSRSCLKCHQIFRSERGSRLCRPCQRKNQQLPDDERKYWV